MIEDYGRYCVVPFCSHRYYYLTRIHLHRLVPGAEYSEDNCVVVCIRHHHPIEGKKLKDVIADAPPDYFYWQHPAIRREAWAEERLT